MNTGRIRLLIQYYEEDPSDPFNIYALALEYMSENPREAVKWFDKLMTDHPDYLPAYYQAARCCDALNRKAEAIEVLKQGIQLAERLNDLKTKSELGSYFDELTFD